MINIRKLSSALEAKAKKLGEDPIMLENGVQTLKDWISKQPHLVNNVRTDDQWLASFLRGCKYRIETAKSKFDMYYTLRYMLPEYYSCLDPFIPKMQEILSNGSYLMLPAYSPDSPRVLLCRTGVVEKFNYEDLMCYHQMIYIYLMLHDDHAMIAGIETIIDIKDTPTELMKHFTVSNLKKCHVISEKALPFRYKRINYVNVHPAAESMFVLMKRFMGEKSRDRLRISQNTDHLVEVYPRRMLPKEYGGDTYTIAEMIEDSKKRIESLAEVLKVERTYKSREEYRTDNKVSKESLFGVDGNFKQLHFD